MIKVFYLVYGLTSGGIEKFSVNVYKYIDKSEFQIDMIVKYNRPEFFDSALIEAGGEKIAILDDANSQGIVKKFKYILNLLKLLKNDYDVAYFNLSSPSAVFKYPLICKMLGVNNIVIHSHSSSEDSKNAIKSFNNKLGRHLINLISTCKFACSEKAAAWMFGKDIKDYIIINNGIETNKYIFDIDIRKRLRHKLGIDNNVLLLGHVGRFTETKNHKFMIDVLEDYMHKDKNVALVFIGVGELIDSVKEYAKEKGILSKVYFLNEQTNVNEWLQAFDMFLLPSLYEGLPIAGIEAQAAGLYCLFSQNVSRLSDVSGMVRFLDLSSVREWTDNIWTLKSCERKDNYKRIVSSGYDIKTTVHQIELQLRKMCGE